MKQRKRSEIYEQVNQHSVARKESNDCTVIAMAMVTGKPYDECHRLLKEAGRQDGKGFNSHIMMSVIKGCGFELKRIPCLDQIAKYPGRHANKSFITSHHPARFNSVWKDGKTYLGFTINHVLAIIDGDVHDWSTDKSLQIRWLYEVVKA